MLFRIGLPTENGKKGYGALIAVGKIPALICKDSYSDIYTVRDSKLQGSLFQDI